MTIPLDYDTLRVIWWLLLGILLIGFAVMDGFDLGVATLLPVVTRDDTERRVLLNAIGPFWDGNQVWLILGAGAIFAAWPAVYATAFSGFYIAMFLVLASLILRPVGFEFRNKFSDRRWRLAWDCGLFAGGLVPSLVFGVAFGNLLQGVPFRVDSDLRVAYEGSGLFELLNPFGLLCGVISLSMLATHGAVYLTVKTTGPQAARAQAIAARLPLLTIVLFLLAGLWVAKGIEGFAISGVLSPNGPSNPLLKTVTRAAGGWLANYGTHPWMLIAPVLGVLGSGLVALLARQGRAGLAFLASALALVGIIATAGLSLFPFLLPSSLEPTASLTVWDASSSHLTLFVMLLAVLLLLPAVVLYASWAYHAMRGTISAQDVHDKGHSLY